MENNGNNRTIPIIWAIIFVLAFTYACAINAWVDSKLAGKADLSDYQTIITKQDEIIRGLESCNMRLAVIETEIKNILKDK